jgi:hypothetical protein
MNNSPAATTSHPTAQPPKYLPRQANLSSIRPLCKKIAHFRPPVLSEPVACLCFFRSLSPFLSLSFLFTPHTRSQQRCLLSPTPCLIFVYLHCHSLLEYILFFSFFSSFSGSRERRQRISPATIICERRVTRASPLFGIKVCSPSPSCLLTSFYPIETRGIRPW